MSEISSYNGYSGPQRMAILRAYKRGEAGPGFSFAGRACGLCGDPDRPAGEWHSEDYSRPFSFLPPQSYPICPSCHSRLHKRFGRSHEEWELFCRHVEAGGYGREFTALYPAQPRAILCARIAAGETVEMASRRMPPTGDRWWRSLTLDPESLEAPWARPRPLRARPSAADFGAALLAIGTSEKELAMLFFHATAPRRTATMRQIAQNSLGRDDAGSANLAYGSLARRLCMALDWQTDRRDDGSPVWMSMIAEGWWPPSRNGVKREYEWVMVPTLAEAVMKAS